LDRYLLKLCSKINKISDFNIILKLINIDNLKENKNIYIELLNDKIGQYVTNNILLSLGNEKLQKAINIIFVLSNIFYLNSKNCKFLSEKINKLDKKMQLKIKNIYKSYKYSWWWRTSGNETLYN